MREVLRTTNLVRLSWLQALLNQDRIESVVLDSHTSVLEGSASAIPRRLMVRDEDFNAAMRLLEESGELGDNRAKRATSALLDGRVSLLQPPVGFRAAIDPLFLAAAVPSTDGRVLDVGCGTGAALLCYADRVRDAEVIGLERDVHTATLAVQNIDLNGVAARARIEIGDLLDPPSALAPGSFDHVMANPPYLRSDQADLRQMPASVGSTVEGDAKLSDWIDFCLAMVAHQGSITVIHRADRLDEILPLLHGRAGGIVVFPLWPGARDDGPEPDAKRVLVQARKGSKAPLRLAAGLVLHDHAGDFTAEADDILRRGGALTL